MNPTPRARPPSVRVMPAARRMPPIEFVEEPRDAEELRLRLDDVPLPRVTLDVDGLRPTLGSLIVGLIGRIRPQR
jgi:hypothetical protein